MTSIRMKYASLCFLSVQTASHVLLTRYSRQHTSEPYLGTVVVALVELIKVFICTAVLCHEQDWSFKRTWRSINREIIFKPKETVKLSVPAGLYVIQNNLLFIALSNLDSATYQVTYQVKILTTAMFAVIMLRKRLETSQWISLLLLTAGVSLVQLAKGDDVNKSSSVGNPMLGMVTVLCAAVTSGFSGVYFEKVLKGSSQSLWIRNIQLAMFGVLLSITSVFINDYEAVLQKGLLQGFNLATWGVVVLGVLSGLTVALVVKYADNILKGFAVSISILISTFVSFFFLNDFNPTWQFFVGAFLVITATFLYGMDFSTKKLSRK